MADDYKNEINQLIEELGKERELGNYMLQFARIGYLNETCKMVLAKNIKIEALVGFIENHRNIKDKYGKLLEENNKQKLNEVILAHHVVECILRNTRRLNFNSGSFNDFMIEVHNLLECTDCKKKKISKFCALCLISAFTYKTLTQSQIEQILNLVDEKLKTKFDISGDSLFAFGDVRDIFAVLQDSAPKKFIQYIIDCIDFEKCKNGRKNYYLFKIVYNLILHDPYSNGNFKQAIKNVLIKGKKYKKFREKLSKCKNFGKDVMNYLKQDNRYSSAEQFSEKLSQEGLDFCFKNGKFKIKYNKIEYTKRCLRLTYVILFVVAFVALFNIWLSFLTVPKIASWIAFGICFAGGLVCAFYDFRINSAKKYEKPKGNIISLTQENENGSVKNKILPQLGEKEGRYLDEDEFDKDYDTSVMTLN